jgi:signal peptidase I
VASKSKSNASEIGSANHATQSSDTQTPEQLRAQEWRIAAGRETIEAFVVAFILALLFRAFLAEAFVIPTGSMAPTLMGAHKDIFCDACNYNFRVGASRENSKNGEGVTVVGGVCPNCRRVNSLDLAGDANDATFNGDRILVSKFSYVLSEPERWDTIVFKYPGNPKQNYIKRLVGLPGETLTLRHGDVYVRPTGSDQQPTIVRKPYSTLMAISHLVHDTDYIPQALAKAGFPSRWQPWTEGAEKPPTDSWQVSRDDGQFTATVDAADSTRWLRYFHHIPTDRHWQVANNGGSLSEVDPYQSKAITDFYGFDSYIFVPSGAVYAYKPFGLRQKLLGETSGVTFNPTYQSGKSLDQFGQMAVWGGQDANREKLGRDGMHWVGDLILQTSIETDSDAKEIVLELIEAGVQYRCTIDLASGDATLGIIGEEAYRFDAAEGESTINLSPTAATPIRAGQSHQISFINCDDQLLLLVDDNPITFSTPTTFNSRTYRGNSANRPRYTLANPMDAAPAGVGVTGGKATIQSLQLRRDKYYISTNTGKYGGICDYDMNRYRNQTGRRGAFKRIQNSLASPSQWDEFVGWDLRRETTFELQEDQFFPMGDNSPESLDARCWAGVKDRIKMPGDVNRDAWRWSDESYVPRDLLVGRAVVVFWPHSWNSPVPFIPNFKRMKLIR